MRMTVRSAPFADALNALGLVLMDEARWRGRDDPAALPRLSAEVCAAQRRHGRLQPRPRADALENGPAGGGRGRS